MCFIVIIIKGLSRLASDCARRCLLLWQTVGEKAVAPYRSGGVAAAARRRHHFHLAAACVALSMRLSSVYNVVAFLIFVCVLERPVERFNLCLNMSKYHGNKGLNVF